MTYIKNNTRSIDQRRSNTPIINKLGLGFFCAMATLAMANQVAHAGTVCYQYDALGRLTNSLTTAGTCPSTLPDPGAQGAGTMALKISYDKAGNRTNYQVAGAEAYAQTTIIVVPLGGLMVLPIKR